MDEDCLKTKSFEECELAILRNAVDSIEKQVGEQVINDPQIKEIIQIVEKFLKDNKLVCYGGTAINNILPKYDQFYDKSVEIPDYDFYSKTPLRHAKKLADIYYKRGYTEVEAKAGLHAGTFKVFVNYIPIADITYLVPEIYNNIFKEAIKIDGIYYCPPTYLRMSMYVELSRPNGNVSRWEKVLKRITLLNKHFPLKGKKCKVADVQRLFDNRDLQTEKNLFNIVKETLSAQKCVFFGAFANKMYLKTMKKFSRRDVPQIPDFDVLSEDPETTMRIIKQRLELEGFDKIKIIEKSHIGEIIPDHHELRVGGETILFVYKPLACHSYNIIKGVEELRLATLDTMLSLYLAFLYSNRPYYDKNRILCMCDFLFRVQQANRLEQGGLLKRFSIDCIGKQETMEEMRAHKSKIYKELKKEKNNKDFEWYFLRYIPHQIAEEKNY